jgi:hypothetical protein
MHSRYIGLMTGAILASGMMAPVVNLTVSDEAAPEPKSKYKAPPRNDELHIKAAAEKRARKAAKRREIQERNAR